MTIIEKMNALIERTQGDPEGADTVQLEGGEKFKALAAKLKKRGAKDPEALAAWIGRKKMGKAAFQKKAAAGQKEDFDFASALQDLIQESNLDIALDDVVQELKDADPEYAETFLEKLRDFYSCEDAEDAAEEEVALESDEDGDDTLDEAWEALDALDGEDCDEVLSQFVASSLEAPDGDEDPYGDETDEAMDPGEGHKSRKTVNVKRLVKKGELDTKNAEGMRSESAELGVL